MVECLVAIILGSLYCLALLQIFSQSLRLSTTSTNNQAAHLIAQNILDSFKDTPIAFIKQSQGIAYNLSPGQANPFHPLPTWLDFTDFTWSKTLVGFPGTVTFQIDPGPDPQSYVGVVTVTWSDSSEAAKTYQTMTLVEYNGSNAYVQNPNPYVSP